MNVPQTQARDDELAAFLLDQTHGFQPEKSFTNRGARYRETLGQTVFGQALAGLKRGGMYHVTDTGIHPLGQWRLSLDLEGSLCHAIVSPLIDIYCIQCTVFVYRLFRLPQTTPISARQTTPISAGLIWTKAIPRPVARRAPKKSVKEEQMIKRHPLKGSNKLKLGIFSANADGGLAITTVGERWKARWDDNQTAAQIADRAGLEFMLPIARWKGFGGETNSREWSFETFTWAAAIAAVTERIAVFMTIHVPIMHPLYAAKALATVDHISKGRAGLNIVCGWNPEEFAMFGVKLDEDRYAQAAEWLEVMEKCYASTDPFDYDGTYYQLKGVVSRPPSIQVPRPVTMNAAFGDAGRNFAAENCEYLFTTFTEIDEGAKHVLEMQERARKNQRQIGLYTVGHVVCRETQAEAEDYYDRYALHQADHAAVDAHIAGKRENSASHDKEAYDQYRQRFAGGAGSYPLVGTPEKIVEDMTRISQQGYAGIALSFVNYTYELPFFCDRVLPLLRDAGLRS